MAESKKEFPTCISEGCTKPGKMVCPKCKKLGIPGSFFCSQECFKGSWAQHKALHKMFKNALLQQAVSGSKKKGRYACSRSVLCQWRSIVQYCALTAVLERAAWQASSTASSSLGHCAQARCPARCPSLPTSPALTMPRAVRAARLTLPGCMRVGRVADVAPPPWIPPVDGSSAEEEAAQGHKIKVLSAEEIERARAAGKVRCSRLLAGVQHRARPDFRHACTRLDAKSWTPRVRRCGLA